MPAENHGVRFLSALLLAAGAGTGLATVQYGAPPPDFNIPTVRGPQPLSQLRGTPVVINFWASWCPPCTDELPYFQRLSNIYGSRIRVVTVDWDEAPGTAQSYLRAHNLSLPVIEDRQSKIYGAYSLKEVPDTVVLDSSGAVTYVAEGGLSWNEIRSAVDQALGDGTASPGP